MFGGGDGECCSQYFLHGIYVSIKLVEISSNTVVRRHVFLSIEVELITLIITLESLESLQLAWNGCRAHVIGPLLRAAVVCLLSVEPIARVDLAMCEARGGVCGSR
jgi:hypothetical protein